MRHSHALLVGCGALGSVIADSLVRAGIGTLSIVDRDIVELTNLQRQILFDEEDVAGGIPKAEAARTKLARINHQVTVNAYVDDFNHRNAERFLPPGVDLILDGLDNFETRYLLNDLAVSHRLPYVYGGAVGMTGMSMTILPHPAHGIPERSAPNKQIDWSEEQATPCLRCIFPEPPPPGTSPTCDTAGVLGPLVLLIGAFQAAQAIKLLTGNIDAVDRTLLSLDLWSNRWNHFDIAAARSEHCPCCGQGVFSSKDGTVGSAATSLCGRNAVQVTTSADGPAIDLGELAQRLSAHGEFTHNRFLLRGTFARERSSSGDPIALTVFPNGRAIIVGTSEPESARSIYAKYVGA